MIHRYKTQIAQIIKKSKQEAGKQKLDNKSQIKTQIAQQKQLNFPFFNQMKANPDYKCPNFET